MLRHTLTAPIIQSCDGIMDTGSRRVPRPSHSRDDVGSCEASDLWKGHGQAKHHQASFEVLILLYMEYNSGMHVNDYLLSPYSDQTDPFNRAPLTADMLTPASDLKTKIERWKSEQRQM